MEDIREANFRKIQQILDRCVAHEYGMKTSALALKREYLTEEQMKDHIRQEIFNATESIVSLCQQNRALHNIRSDIQMPDFLCIHGQATGSEAGLYPMVSKTGIQVMSTNLLLPNETDPVIWRGPVISGVVQQFWTDVLWNCDYLFVDMPPGTGDVSLSVFQSIPLDGIVIVASPQELVSMVVEKAVKMAEMMEVPIVGLVENMSYVTCPDCGKQIHLFGQGKTAEAAERHHLPVLAEMPIDPALAALTDAGDIESFQGSWLEAAADKLEGK